MLKLISFVSIIILPLIITSFLAISQRDGVIRIGSKIEVLQKKKKTLLRDKKELLAKLEHLKSLDRIEEIAREQLGMKQPEPEQRVFLTAQALGKRLNKN